MRCWRLQNGHLQFKKLSRSAVQVELLQETLGSLTAAAKMSLGKRKADQIKDAGVSRKAAKSFPQVTVAYHECAAAMPIIGLSSPPATSAGCETDKTSQHTRRLFAIIPQIRVIYEESL